jgi:hypothetical protein
MPTPTWLPGNPYPTGSLVQPVTAVAPVPTSLDNPGFDDGSTSGWTFTGAGTKAVTTLNSQSGTYNLACDNGEVVGINDENPTANPGLTIKAQIYVRLSQSGTSAGRVRLWWFDAGNVQIGAPVDGNLVQKPGNQSERWVLSSLSAVAPALTASVKVGFWTNSGVGGGDTRVDSLSWDYTSASAPSGLIYKAVQPALGISDATEPVWPSMVGVQVVDGSVIWEAMIANRVVWEASPIMVSGGAEPTWPEIVGESVTDGTVSWETVSLRVEDENCPNSKVVTIASSKVYAADEDIVRYSATVNPLDWTSEDDAGYLPTGLNQYGSNRTAVLNTYRGNVVSFSASTFQNWQVDPDPANITLLDSMEGIGSTYQQAAHPVANDLFYLSPLGVRTVGIAAGTSNLSAGDAGAPIDPLVQAALTVDGVRPLAAYYPNRGQYWLCMRPPLPIVTGPSISGDAPDGQVGTAWGPYQYTITAGDAPIANTYISDGSLPAGFAISATGEVTCPGNPEDLGTYTFTVTTVDENGLSASVDDSIAISAYMLAVGAVNGVVNGTTGSGNGFTWGARLPQPVNCQHVLGVANGRFLSWASQDVIYTDDLAVTWNNTTGDLIPIGGDKQAAYKNGVIIIGNAASGYARSTDNGLTITNIGSPGFNYPAFNDESSPRLLVALNGSSTFEYSVDMGLTFTTGVAHGLSLASGGSMHAIGEWFALGGRDGPSPGIVFTKDGISIIRTVNLSPTSGSFPTVTAICAAEIDEEVIWVFGVNNGDLFWSDDYGVTYTKSAQVMAGDANKCVWNGVIFAMVCGSNSSDGEIWTSPDGKVWTKQTQPLLYTVNGIGVAA